MKSQMQKTLDKIYLPSQDQIVDGLSQFNDQEANNMLKGHEQSLEMTHTLQKAAAGHINESDMNMGGPNVINAATAGFHAQETALVDQNQWAQEVRKADERCESYHLMISDLQ